MKSKSKALTTPIAKGTQIGSFVVDRQIGFGAQGVVCLATDQTLQRKVALKIIFNLSVDDDKMLEEARLTASLEHMHIVRVYQIGKDRGVGYIALEYVAGGALEDMVKRSGRLQPRRATKFALALAEGLELAHRAQMVHRDIKPKNLLVSSEGILKIADFGLAYRYSEARNMGKTIGTPKYLAPECWKKQPATPASDIYSAGGSLFFMLVGREPFPSKTLDEVREAHLSRDIRIPDSVPQCLADIIRKCMHKEPAKRLPSAKALRLALKTCLAELSRGRPARLEAQRPDEGFGSTLVDERMIIPACLLPFAENPEVSAAVIFSNAGLCVAQYMAPDRKSDSLQGLYRKFEALEMLRNALLPSEQLRLTVLRFSKGWSFSKTAKSLTLHVLTGSSADFVSLSVAMNVAILKYQRDSGMSEGGSGLLPIAYMGHAIDTKRSSAANLSSSAIKRGPFDVGPGDKKNGAS